MKKINECKNFEEFIKEYELYNEKSKYFKIDMKGSIIIKEPSYILEIGYMYFKGYFNILEYLSFDDIYVRKEKKILRLSSYDINVIKERFFRSIFNRDGIHSLRLANELLLRNPKYFFEIMYINAKLSIDNNRMVKIFLFEKIFNENGLIDSLLINLINYFTKSKEGYSNNKKYDTLYQYIYNLKFNEILFLEKEIFDNNLNREIYLFLKGDNYA